MGTEKTLVTARPSRYARSTVISSLARPRIPSVPKRTGMTPLGVLRSLARLFETVLLGLLLTRVTREQSGLLERGTNTFVELQQRTRDTESQGASLTGDAASFDGGVDVVGLLRVDETKWLHHHLAVRRGGEVVVECTRVDRDRAGARTKTNARDGLFAAAGGLGKRDGHDYSLTAANRRGVKLLWRLRHVGVLGAGVDEQLVHLRATEAILRHHATNGVGDELRGVRVHQGLPRRRAKTARVARVVIVEVLCGLVGGDDDLVGVHDDDVITGVDVGCVEGAVLTAKQRSSDGGDATEDQTFGVDDQPLARQLTRFW